MKPNDTVPDGLAEHDTDPTNTKTNDTTDPGAPPQHEEPVDDVLDGFGGRPKPYFAKHQPVSNGRSAARYDAVSSPPKAHTDPSLVAPVILAHTAEEPIGKILQDASREAAQTPPVPPPDPARNATTHPGTRVKRRSTALLIPALVMLGIVAVSVFFFTRKDDNTPRSEPASTAPTSSSSPAIATRSAGSPQSIANSVPSSSASATIPRPVQDTNQPAAPNTTSALTTGSPPAPRTGRPTRTPDEPRSASPPPAASHRNDVEYKFE